MRENLKLDPRTWRKGPGAVLSMHFESPSGNPFVWRPMEAVSDWTHHGRRPDSEASVQS